MNTVLESNMKKVLIYLVCGLTCAVFTVISLTSPDSSFFKIASNTISIVSGIVLLVDSLYNWFIWKCLCSWKPKSEFGKAFRSLFVKEPFIDGKWNCELSWFKACFACTDDDKCINCDCHKPGKQNSTIIISQKKNKIIVRYDSKTAISVGLDGRLIQDADGKWRLFYSYLMNPKQIGDKQTNAMHYGYANLVVSDDWKRLDGKYVTERETYGDMNLNKIEE